MWHADSYRAALLQALLFPDGGSSDENILYMFALEVTLNFLILDTT